MRKIALAIAAGLIAGPAYAVENAAPISAAAPAETPTAAPSAAEPSPAAAPAESKPRAAKAETHDKSKDADKDKSKDRKQAEKAKPAVSRQAYVKLLAAEIKRHAPKSSEAQTGSIHVAFTIGSAGRVVSHKVQSASNPALEPVVTHILAAVRTVPPPGGSFSAVQEFNFH
ncbi:energy transducer TonB [Methylosinus sporium]|uniref:Energy transducer TonB n=1 Tax=Methylosinus sporium TaxID=428 RepID=A0A549SXN0_METSR|nr:MULTISPECIES: energy transducer TonB [Methylosinus]MBU3889397.1 energy transducer TonB [Methylosinus sp. KRF6]TRL34399.1 energy transducer TonB [Methylosinus sporium]